MKLKKFITLDYKSAKCVRVDLSDNMVNTLIGVNDCGKSTLLKSLKLFFDDKASVSFESESTKRSVLSNTPLTKKEFDEVFTREGLPIFNLYDENMLGILCIFEIDKDRTINELEDLNVSPHLQYVLNDKKEGDTVPILRIFSASGNKSSYHIVANDSVDNEGVGLELWNQTQAALKQKQADSGIKDADIVNRNATGPLKNIERAFAIYEKISTSPIWSTYASIKKDSALLPAFRYLDWNITTQEINQITSDIIQPIINSRLKSIQTKVNTERDEINTEANAALEKIYKKYASSLPASITGINANVNLGLQTSVTELFVEKSTSDKKIYLEDQGDGVRRQISLGLIKALAQESLEEGEKQKKFIWCFDEPETHLFPQAQRDLADSLSLLAKTSFQVLVSTHSTLFVDRSSLSDISLLSLQDGYTVIQTTGATEDIYTSLGVRNSDFLFYDRFIAVEGPTEHGVFNHFYKLVYGKNLADDGIQLINLSGKGNISNQERLMGEIFNDFQKQEDITLYAIDKDTGRQGTNVVLIGTTADFEDSISDEVWINILTDYCKVEITQDQMNDFRADISIMDHNKKLHIMLASYVAEKKEQDENVQYLPSKGDALADMLIERLTDAAQVPLDVKTVFERARQGLIV